MGTGLNVSSDRRGVGTLADVSFAADSSEPARSPHAVWDEIGEAFIRELDFSHIILKLNLAEKETREEILATKTIDMNEFLETCLVRRCLSSAPLEGS